MDYPIAIDPGLDLDLDDLAAAWNETPDCRALAQAQLISPGAESFSPIAQQGFILLTGAAAASALALDALKDALKARLSVYFEQKLQRKPPPLDIEWQRQSGRPSAGGRKRAALNKLRSPGSGVPNLFG